MRWPWVSAARLEDAQNRLVEAGRVTESRLSDVHARLADADREIEWLRGRVQDLEDKRERRDRVGMGMSEAPRAERVPLEPMPPELREYIMGYADPHGQRAQAAVAYRRHARGEPWNEIIADTIEPEDEEETR